MKRLMRGIGDGERVKKAQSAGMNALKAGGALACGW
jgi:hypothetical protein